MSTPTLLTDAQIQSYLVNGYLTVHTTHDPSFHQRIHRQIEHIYATAGNPGNDILPRVPDLRQVLQDPAVDGALQSLLGPDYLVHPHRHCHHNTQGSGGQNMHQDSYEDDQNVRHHRTRWTMAFYYPQDVALDMGPTAILPASQYYHSAEQAHQREELPLCGRAGTVTIVHYDLWHRAMPNESDRDRFMVKFLFTRMSEPQAPTWDHRDGTWTVDADDPPINLCRRAWDWMRGEATAADCNGAPLDELDQALQASDEAERLQAVYALAARGDEAMPVLLEALRREAAALLDENMAAAHTNPSQLDTVLALSSVGRPAVPHMLALLEDEAWYLRAAAADVLGDLGTIASDTVPQLVGALDDGHEWVRRNAAEALGNIGAAAFDAVPALSRCLLDEHSWIRHNAAMSLAKIGPSARDAIPSLKANVYDEGTYACANAQMAIERLGA